MSDKRLRALVPSYESCRIEMDPATIDALIECLNRCKAFLLNSQAYATNVARMEDDGHR